MRNRGLELLLGIDVAQGRQLAAGATLTASLNENRLLELGAGVVVTSPTTQGFRQDVGYPLYGQWGRTVASYADVNGNGIIEPGEITVTANHYLGPGFPTREVTASPYVTLLGGAVRINALFQYRGGHYLRDLTTTTACRFPPFGCREANDISTPLLEQAVAVAGSQLSIFGDFNRPSSYAMLRELSVELGVPHSLVRTIGARDARVTVAGRNVAVLSKRERITAPENDMFSAEQFAGAGGNGPSFGPSTYWILRVNLNY